MTGTHTSPTLYLVDASIYVFRAYFSIPDTFRNTAGESVNAVYGYTQFLLDLAERQPCYVAVAFDESLNTCYRNAIYPAYKANRDEPDANLLYQFEQCQRITELLGFHGIHRHDYEADDIIGSLLGAFPDLRPVAIVTRDKDLGQLLTDGVVLWDFAADKYTDIAGVREKFGVDPAQIADYLALAGDTVDNIPGAPGIGAKTAAALLNHFGSLENLLSRIDEVADVGVRGAGRIKSTLQDNIEVLRTYRSITSIHCEVPLQVTRSDLEVTPAPASELDGFCDELNFGRGVRDRLARNSGQAT